MTAVGIDVSKNHLDVSLSGGTPRRYAKTPKALAQVVKDIPSDAVCVVEATGTYHLSVVYYLHEHHRLVKVANPLTTKAFALSDLPRAKTDSVDARMLSAFAASNKGRFWQPKSKVATLCQQKQTALDHLTENNARTRNVLESLRQYPAKLADTTTIERLEDCISVVEEQITALKAEMQERLDEEFGAMRENIASIPGIGQATAMKLITCTDGLRSFTNVKQLVALIGLCPDITSSGSSVQSARLTNFCLPSLRRDIYMCALSAKFWNHACKEVYQQEYSKHRIHKKAMIRVAHKLVRQIFAVAKHNCRYDASIGVSKHYETITP